MKDVDGGTSQQEFCNTDKQCLMHTEVHAYAKQVISHMGVRMAEVCKALSHPATR